MLYAMGKKEKYIHIRSDEDLKAALKESAGKHMRKESDEARYLLMKALGLLIEEDTTPYQVRGRPSQNRKG